jgi:hypothetical protein
MDKLIIVGAEEWVLQLQSNHYFIGYNYTARLQIGGSGYTCRRIAHC